MTRRTPNLNALKVFDVAARHLNFRLASQELNVTQGAVAQQVRKLESDLEQPLFIRKARGLELTKIGVEYHQSISQALAMINEATLKLLPNNALVTLSISPSFASKWLVPRLSSFYEKHPNIEVQTIASEGLANFKSDGVDLAVRQGLAPLNQNLQYQLLSPLKLCAVCSPSFAKKLNGIDSLADLVSYPLIQDSHKSWEILLKDNGLTPSERIMQFNQTALAMDAASNDQGIALAPAILLDFEIEQHRLVKIWEDTREEQEGYYLVFASDAQENFARDTLIDWFLDQVKQSLQK